jgi:flagellar L-ring protein precursor FlgH
MSARIIGRNDSVQSTVNNLFGLPTSFGHSSKTTQFNPNINYTSANTLQGSGATAQSDTFSTTVSTMVQRIRPNGDLVIAGNDEVKLVGGKEFIRIAGVVRPEDLSATSSNRRRWPRRISSSAATAKPIWRQRWAFCRSCS